VLDLLREERAKEKRWRKTRCKLDCQRIRLKRKEKERKGKSFYPFFFATVFLFFVAVFYLLLRKREGEKELVCWGCEDEEERNKRKSKKKKKKKQKRRKQQLIYNKPLASTVSPRLLLFLQERQRQVSLMYIWGGRKDGKIQSKLHLEEMPNLIELRTTSWSND